MAVDFTAKGVIDLSHLHACVRAGMEPSCAKIHAWRRWRRRRRAAVDAALYGSHRKYGKLIRRLR